MHGTFTGRTHEKDPAFCANRRGQQGLFYLPESENILSNLIFPETKRNPTRQNASLW